jgi:hypothetical protein
MPKIFGPLLARDDQYLVVATAGGAGLAGHDGAGPLAAAIRGEELLVTLEKFARWWHATAVTRDRCACRFLLLLLLSSEFRLAHRGSLPPTRAVGKHQRRALAWRG